MIIRHDLKLVFVHVPKCAGKEIRRILKSTSEKQDVEELWNFEYNKVLDRYVDLAHLPMSDLRSYEQFEYLESYKVIACIRNPYLRLRSAVNEYYRQKSQRCEKIVKEKGLTDEMENKYYKKLKRGHRQLDPRYIHSLPIYRFTHYGEKPKVDHFVRCENLKEDLIKISQELEWPDILTRQLESKISDKNPDKGAIISERAKRLAEEIYKVDFEVFDYPIQRDSESLMIKRVCRSGKTNDIHSCDEVSWHWGPKAVKEYNIKKSTRGGQYD